MSRRNGVAIALALLVACDSGSDSATSLDEAEPAPTQAEQIADAMRESRLIGEEMQTVEGPSVLATVERGGGSMFATSPNAGTTSGYFSIDARFNDGKSVMVYVPEDVVVPNGVLIYVVAGQHGYYFRSFASDVQP
jgi:hypothetical protein